MKTIFIAALALTAAMPAYAQDAATFDSSTDRSLTGLRVEGRAGWDRVELELEASDGVDSLSGNEGKSGVMYGVEAGYDIKVSDNGVLGSYVGIEDSSTKECIEVFGGDEACLKTGRNITVGVRGGFVTGPGSMVYVKGGYSNGKYVLDYEDPAFPEDNFELSDKLDGFHLGAGGEVSLGANAYAKLEYVYTRYSGYEYDDGDVAGDLDVERHQILAGVGIRF